MDSAVECSSGEDVAGGVLVCMATFATSPLRAGLGKWFSIQAKFLCYLRWSAKRRVTSFFICKVPVHIKSSHDLMIRFHGTLRLEQVQTIYLSFTETIPHQQAFGDRGEKKTAKGSKGSWNVPVCGTNKGILILIAFIWISCSSDFLLSACITSINTHLQLL